VTTDNVAPHSLPKEICRACSKRDLDARRGDLSSAKRTLFNFKQTCRSNGIEERVLWTIDDIQRLIDQCESDDIVKEGKMRGIQIKYRIVRIDKTKPFLPDNAEAKIY
jgi:hypothetical protein